MLKHPTIFARPRRAARAARTARGFTLLEAALTTMIVGVGLVATMALLAAGTNANIEGQNTTTGVNLAKNMRELSMKSTFAEVRAMNGRTYSPPRDSRGEQVVGFDNWTQSLTVQPVDRNRLSADIVDPNPHVVRVTVRIHNRGSYVNELTWYRFRPMP